MIRWVDTRDTLPPIGMMVLVYVRDRLEIFEDYITSARCYYDITCDDSRDHKYYDTDLPNWVLKNVNGTDLCDSVQTKGTIIISKKDIDNKDDIIRSAEEVLVEVTHWTLIPSYTSHEWIDIEKYPPPLGLDVLVYMKDSCEDKEDFITAIRVSHFPVNNRVHKNNPGEYFYKPICWTLYPPMPKNINDDFV